jgi:hypothetical protein
MARTAQEQLDDIDTLIEEIETSGQSVSQDGSTLTRANLETLYKRRDLLEMRVNRAAAKTSGSNRLKLMEWP